MDSESCLWQVYWEVLAGDRLEGSERSGLGKGDSEQPYGYRRGLSPSSGRWRAVMLLQSRSGLNLCISQLWLCVTVGGSVTLGETALCSWGQFLV